MARVRSADLAALAEHEGTPFYLYDSATATAVVRRWKRACAPDVRMFYPFKCNRYPALLDRLAGEGLGAEINVVADFSGALERGMTGERLILHGPAKAPGSVDRILAVGGTLVADSVEDARSIVERARAVGRSPRYLLRLKAPQAREGQRGFGMLPSEIVRFGTDRARRREPPPAGISFHLGTGIASPGPYREAIGIAGETGRALRLAGVPIEIVDAGGGFPSPGESRFDDRGRPQSSRWTDPAAIVRDLSNAVRRSLGKVELWIEPGRALAADAFILVTRVIRVRGDRDVFVDGSRMSHGFFIPRGAHPVTIVPRRRGKRRALVIAGPLGTDMDVLVRRAVAVAPRAGDLVVFGAVGAYNLIAASTWAGPIPPVIEVDDIRRGAR